MHVYFMVEIHGATCAAGCSKAHQVNRAAHVDVDEVRLDGVFEQLHAAGHAVWVRATDLHPEDVLGGMSLQQRPL